MTTPGEGHETVECSNCHERVGGDEPFCPICNHALWEDGFDEDAEIPIPTS